MCTVSADNSIAPLTETAADGIAQSTEMGADATYTFMNFEHLTKKCKMLNAKEDTNKLIAMMDIWLHAIFVCTLRDAR